MYGAHHFGHYDFLVSLSDKMCGNGLEHHRSSEDGTSADFLIEYKTVRIAYHDGLKYPHLVRDKSKSDTLTTLLTPLR